MKFKSKAIIFIYVTLLLVMMFVGCGEKPNDNLSTPKPPLHLKIQSSTEKEEELPRSFIVTAGTRSTYQWYCAQCHGIKGKGDGINAKFLTVPPRNHTKAEYLETRTEEQFFQAIKFGGLSVGRAPCMPAWGNTLSDSTIHELVRYIRELCQCEAL